MPSDMQPDYWTPIATYVLPPVGALLSAIALWVGARARTTSADALSTSQAAVSLSLLSHDRRDANGSLPPAPDRRKS